MKRKFGYVLFAVIICLMGIASGAEKSGSKTGPLGSTLEDQSSVAVTIYNVNLGLVKDQRSINLPKGTGELKFMDVASQIIPTSVHIKSVTNADSLQVLEQNYEYDLLNPQKLLDKYVGKEIRLYNKNPYTEREEIVAATL